jgi:hypothetical protein
MNGYLMLEKKIKKGEPVFLKSMSPENNYAVVFEDDGDTGYFYAIEMNGAKDQNILDALHIYQVDEEEQESARILIVWAKDWLKCALVMNEQCHAIFDFENGGGYNVSEFPPPNSIWTKHGRALTKDLVDSIFG